MWVRVRVGVALRGFLTKARVPLTPVRQRDENSASQPHIIRLSGTAAYFLSLLFPFFFVFVSQQLVLLSYLMMTFNFKVVASESIQKWI